MQEKRKLFVQIAIKVRTFYLHIRKQNHKKDEKKKLYKKKAAHERKLTSKQSTILFQLKNAYFSKKKFENSVKRGGLFELYTTTNTNSRQQQAA